MKLLKTVEKFFFILAVLGISSVNRLHGQTKAEKIDKLVAMYAEYGQFNGSVLVSEKGNVIYKNGFGFANMEWNIPNQADTKFRLGSITKQFTAMAVMQLVEQGKLKLDVPISTYLPDYPKKNADIITVHHLLCHSSGIPNYTTRNFIEKYNRDPYTPTTFLKFFADSTLDFKPGEKFSYSNSGYFLLGVIIEKVTGKPYEQVLQENIFTPLHMNNTGYDHSNTILKNRAAAYEKNGRNYVNANYLDMSIPYAAGSLYSTVEDLYLWDQALYTDQLLKKENKDMLFKKQMEMSRGYYGYGWIMNDMPIGNTKELVQTIGHSGGINGFRTMLTRFPADKSMIILLNNTGGAPLQEMTIAISGILYDKTYDLPKRSLAFLITDIIGKDGIEAGLSFYKANKDSKAFQLDEGELVNCGYGFLQTGKIKEAVAVFKLSTEAFPKGFNTYDSYGEALLMLKDTVQAIANYKKSIKINPGNDNGLKVLKSLGVNTDDLIVKVPVENLKLLEGEYIEIDPKGKPRKIVFTLIDGVLNGDDRGYKYKIKPVGENTFINPDDGASLVFDTNDKKAITLLLFGKVKLKKV